MYTIESEFFAHTDLCFPHSLLFSISRLDFSSVWLPSLLPTRIRPLSATSSRVSPSARTLLASRSPRISVRPIHDALYHPAADGNHDAHRDATPKAARGIVGGEREYFVECESLFKFIGSDTCYLTLLFLLFQYSIPSLYLALFTASARVRRFPEICSRFIEGNWSFLDIPLLTTERCSIC